MSGESAPAIGIDIGTSYCCVGVFKNGKVQLIANEQGNYLIPSTVAFTESQIFVGEEAEKQFTENPTKNVIFGAKKIVGCHVNDPPLQAYTKYRLFNVTCENDLKEAKFEVDYKGETRTFSPEEVISMMLFKLKIMAEENLGMSISCAVLSVPSCYNSVQRQKMRDAAKIAGLEVLRLVNESSAAAITYGFNNRTTVEKNVLVFNMGAGYLDISIVNIIEDCILEIKSYANKQLGGDDFDNLMISYFVQDFRRKYKKDVKSNNLAMQRLRRAWEDAKQTLSLFSGAKIKIDSLYQGINYNSCITRDQFEEFCSFRDIYEPIEKALRDAKLNRNQISNIVLAGGSTRIPGIQKLLKHNFLGKDMMDLYTFDDPQEVVVSGTAILAALLSGDKSKEIEGVLVIDVIPYSLGVEASKGEMDFVIKRNSAIPTVQEQAVKVDIKNKTDDKLMIRIYEGESTMAKDNMLIDTLSLDRPEDPESKIGSSTWVKVKFDIDTHGTLKASAVIPPPIEKSDIEIENQAECVNEEATTASSLQEEKLKFAECATNCVNEDKTTLTPSTQEPKLKLAEYCAKVKLAVEDILVKCIEIDRGIKKNEITETTDCKEKEEQLNRIIRHFFDQTYKDNEPSETSFTTAFAADDDEMEVVEEYSKK